MPVNDQKRANVSQPSGAGNWVRKGNTVVNKVTGGGVEEFIQAVKNRDADAYGFLDNVVVKRICGERIAKIAIHEKTLQADEVWGVFENWIMADDGLSKCEKPESFVPYLHCCLRDKLTKFIKKESKRRQMESPTLDAPVNFGNGDNEGTVCLKDLMSEDLKKSDNCKGRLDENDREVVRDCFDKFWRQNPLEAILVGLKSAEWPNSFIIKALGLEMSENTLTQRIKRAKQKMVKRLKVRHDEMIG